MLLYKVVMLLLWSVGDILKHDHQDERHLTTL